MSAPDADPSPYPPRPRAPTSARTRNGGCLLGCGAALLDEDDTDGAFEAQRFKDEAGFEFVKFHPQVSDARAERVKAHFSS